MRALKTHTTRFQKFGDPEKQGCSRTPEPHQIHSVSKPVGFLWLPITETDFQPEWEQPRDSPDILPDDPRTPA